jgi:hypothetical protein
MAVEYSIIIKNPAGTTQRVLTGQEDGFLWLSYKKELNAPGLLIFDVESSNTAIFDLEVGGQVEVWRRNESDDIDWYCDFYAFFRDEERRADDDGIGILRAICPGQMDLLADAIVAWPADTANRSYFDAVKASTIMTNLVRYNVTSDATTGNGRIRTTDQTHITYETDDDAGNVMTFACAHAPLLSALQDVARIGGRDFWLDRTADQTWTFRTDDYYGDDRSLDVVFALNYGNMSNPILRRNRLNERTVAIVGGQGTEADRDFVVRTGTNYDATDNSREVFYAATEYSTTDGLNAAGDIRLDELRARDDLTWDVIQTPGCLYGQDYFLGDLVTGYYEGISATKQISAVTVTFEPGSDRAETIAVETQNV